MPPSISRRGSAPPRCAEPRAGAPRLRQLREDAGLSPARRGACRRRRGSVRRAGSRTGAQHPSNETLMRLGLVLGADLRVRLYPNTGPLIRDRHQARMLGGAARDRRSALARVHRGRRAAARAGAGSMPCSTSNERTSPSRPSSSPSFGASSSSSGGPPRRPRASRAGTAGTDLGTEPRIDRLLIVRRTRATRAIAADFARQLRAAYPAHPDDALAALTGTAPVARPGARVVRGRRPRGPPRRRSMRRRWYAVRSLAAAAEHQPHEQPANTRREDLGRPRRLAGRGGARRPRDRPPPRPRGHQPAGVHGPPQPRARASGRPDKTVATADHGTPTTPRGLPIMDMQAATQIAQLETNCRDFGIPLHAFGSDTQGIVHVIGPELGLTQPGMTIVCGDCAHGDPRRVRGARVRHRDERGRDGPRDADAAPAPAEDLRGARRRQAERRRQREGHHPRPDRPDRHRRRHRARVRVPRRGDPRAEHGTADDDLQHEHRGRRAGRPRRARRHDVRVPPRPPPRAAGRGLGRRRRRLAHAPDRRRRDVRQVDRRSTRRRSSRWSPGATTRAWACRSRGRLPRPEEAADDADRAAASSARSSTWR